MLRPVFVCLLFALFIALPAEPAQSDAMGRWTGAIDIMGQKLDIVVTLTEQGGTLKGSIDIPQQGAKALPLTNVRADGGKVHFELQAGPGLAVFEGELKDGGVSGTFEQSGFKGAFTLTRAAIGEPKPVQAAEPPPYRGEPK